MLRTNDKNDSVEAYALRGRSALYSQSMTKCLPTLEAFLVAKQRYPDIADLWLQQLTRVTVAEFPYAFSEVPSERISTSAVEFGVRLLTFNQKRLLDS